MPTPIRSILFAGSGAFGLPTLKRLRTMTGVTLHVVSQPDRPAGRGRKLAPTPIAAYALEHHLPLLRTDSINTQTLPDVDAMVVIAFGQKISQTVVNRPRWGAMNLHASLLPKYRGAAPIHWAILNGEIVTGNSIIRLADRMDAGAILAQSHLDIGECETTGELHDRLAEDGAGLIAQVLAQFEANGTVIEHPQDESLASIAPKLSREQSMIDWNQPAENVARRIRGLCPWPGCRVRLLDAARNEVARATLLTAKVVPGEGDRWAPGEIDCCGAVNAGNGAQAVEIVQIQPEGRRPMSLADYRRGYRWQPGLRLESVLQ